jgi:hypothetical protein
MTSIRLGVSASALAVGMMMTIGAGAEGALRSLPYSSASNQVVQRQPRDGSCHAVGSGPFVRPDRRCTPGALNPAVRQSSIHRTICQAGWTAKVRPPVDVSEPEKFASMAAYDDHRPAGHYEYDHLVPLELGGATNDRRNLWPEPGGSPNRKDGLENALRRKVCDGKLKLGRAQHMIATNWVAAYRALHHSTSPSGSTPSGTCRVNASYSSSYGDWDVYVHSNQPHAKASVTDSHGRSASWYTNASGYADVYFHAPHSAAGETIKVHVGTASCSTSL